MYLFATPPHFSIRERQAYIPYVHNNIVDQMQALVRAAEASGSCLAALGRSRAVVKALKNDCLLSTGDAVHLKDLWLEDPGIEDALFSQDTFQFSNNLEYFMTRLDAAVAPDFLPTIQDCIQVEWRPSGIESSITIQGHPMSIIDVGGRLNFIYL